MVAARFRFAFVVGAVVACPLLAHCGGERSFFVLMPQRLPPDTSLPDTSTMDVDLVDLDADGDLDIFVAEGTGSQEGRQNRLLINDGTGYFSDESEQRLPPGMGNSSRSDEGDVDGDGDIDIVVANLGPEQLLLNDGEGFFTDVSAEQLPPPPLADISAEARFVDVDGDGDLDILVANENPFTPTPFGGGQNRLWINDGAGWFTDETEGRLPAATDQTGALVAGDLDGDGDADIVVLDRGQDRVLINDGTGRFQDETAARLPVTDDSTRGGELADLDGDGDLDLLVANSRGEEPAVYLNDGVGDFSQSVFSTSDYRHERLTSVAVGDVDGDGDVDAVFGDAGGWVSAHGFLGGQNLYFENDGRGLFLDRTRETLPEIADPTTDVELGDVDGDGDLDLVVGNSGAAEGLLILEPWP